MNKGAVFSPDRKYRYSLWRIWDERLPLLLLIMLNGSTANENQDDPTVTRGMYRAGHGRFGGLLVGNEFGYATLDPDEMMRQADPVGPDNDLYLREMIAGSGLQVCAWGNYGGFRGRDKIVRAMVSEPYCLGINSTGHPRHPLYVPYSTGFTKWQF